MKDVYIVENVVSSLVQEIIKDEIFSLSFPWVLLDNITYSDDKESTYYGLNHTFLARDRGTLTPIFPYLLPIVTGCVERMGLTYEMKNIEAGRVFLQLPMGTESRQNTPHVDMLSPHWVFLYYVNDSDGDTVFFEKSSPWDTKLEYGEEKFTEIKRITPKQGTCIVFDGSIYHASSSPTKNKRCVINFDYKK